MLGLNKLVSIPIPCYEMSGFGAKFLNESLSKINEQTYKNVQKYRKVLNNKIKIMKKSTTLFLYIIAILTALVLVTSCVSKHPKCAAYDNVQIANQ